MGNQCGLKIKIMAGVSALIVLFGTAVLASVFFGVSGALKDEMSRRGVMIAQVLAHSAEAALLTEDEFSMHEMLDRNLRSYRDLEYIYVLDPKGRVLNHTFERGFPRALAAAPPVGGGGEGAVRRIRIPAGVVREVSIPMLDGRLGRVYVGMKEYAVRERLLHLMMGPNLIAGLMLLVGAGVAYWLTRRLCGRLEQLVGLARKVGGGDLDVRADDAVGDELGLLARALNGMTRDLHRSQRQLIRSGKLAAIGELASSIAHEINNPLNTMAVCAQALLDRAESPDLRAVRSFKEFPEYLEAIDAEIFRCKKITSGLLSFARFKEPKESRIDVNPLVEETIPLVSHRARLADVRIRFEGCPGEAEILADADQIRQVLLNMLINAIDHMPNGGDIHISTERAKSGIRLIVEDEGTGIRPEHIRRLFDPFFTTKAPGKGTGLGLAVCQKIVDGHHGSIKVSSRLGKGTVFTVILPTGTETRVSALPAGTGGAHG